MSTHQPTPVLGTLTTSRLARASRRLAFPVLLAGTFMVVLDFFIVSVALPSLQRELHAGASSLEWIVAGYALTSTVFLVSAGRLGDRLGHRRVFSLGLALFTLSSAACGLAWNRPSSRTTRAISMRRSARRPGSSERSATPTRASAAIPGVQARRWRSNWKRSLE
jgi:MFS family permease